MIIEYEYFKIEIKVFKKLFGIPILYEGCVHQTNKHDCFIVRAFTKFYTIFLCKKYINKYLNI